MSATPTLTPPERARRAPSLADRPGTGPASGAEGAESAARVRARAVLPHRWWLRPLVVGLVARAVILLIALVVASVGGADPGAGPWPDLPAGSELERMLSRYDGAWYLQVVEHGYADDTPAGRASAAFFPVFPLMTLVVAALPGVAPITAALAVASALGVLATVLVWRLTAEVVDVPAADRAMVLLAVFPGSFVLSMAYSEALLVAAAAGCLLALVQRRWLLAGLAAAVASGARPTGIVLGLACAWAAAAAVGRDRAWRALVAPLLAPAGAVAFFVHLWWRTGDLLAWFEVQRTVWGERMGPAPTVPGRLAGLLEQAPSLDLREMTDLVGCGGLVLVVAGLLGIVRWRPPAPVLVYTVGVLLLAALSTKVGFRPRMLLAAFPLVIAFFVLREPRFWGFVVAAGLANALLAAMTFGTLAATP